MTNKLSIEQFLSKYYRDSSHAQEVRKLSLMLFDEVNQHLKNMSSKKRDILEVASLLHDIGYNIDSKKHNDHSYTLITENGIKGYDDEELELIALVAKYHRGNLPDKNKHMAYSLLPKKGRNTVKRLAAILRICDGLDRAHLKLIKNLKCEYDEMNSLFIIYLNSNINDYLPDIAYAIKKKDLFEKVYKVQVVFKFEL